MNVSITFIKKKFKKEHWNIFREYMKFITADLALQKKLYEYWKVRDSIALKNINDRFQYI